MSLDQRARAAAARTVAAVGATVDLADAFGDLQGRRRVRTRTTIVAALTVIVLVVGLLITLTAHEGTPRPVPAGPEPRVTTPAYHHNGEILTADFSRLLAKDPSTGRLRTIETYCPGADSTACMIEFAVSPDGERVATVQGELVPSYPLDAASGGVYVLGLDGLHAQRLSGCSTKYGCPTHVAWSPDGARLAVTTGGRLETMDPSGGHRHTVVSLEGDLLADPAWSPDGRRLAFVATSGPRERTTGLYLVGADGNGLTEVVEHPAQGSTDESLVGESTRVGLSDPTWTADGRELLYLDIGPCRPTCTFMMTPQQRPLVSVIRLNLSSHDTQTLLATTALGSMPIGGCACHAYWPPSLAVSPDGQKLVLLSPTGLWLLNPDGSGFHLIGESVGGQVAWRPVP